jgi:hypothetical protein
MSAEAELKAEIAELRERLAKLEDRANPKPPPKFDAGGPRGPTTTELAISRLGMSREVMADHVRAVGGVVVREIVGDGGAAATLKPLAGTNPTPTVAQENRSGWRDPGPLSPPPGISLIDRLVEVQTARDTAELISKEAQRLAKK